MRKSIFNLRKLKIKAILKKYSGYDFLTFNKNITEFTQNTLNHKSRHWRQNGRPVQCLAKSLRHFSVGHRIW